MDVLFLDFVAVLNYWFVSSNSVRNHQFIIHTSNLCFLSCLVLIVTRLATDLIHSVVLPSVIFKAVMIMIIIIIMIA